MTGTVFALALTLGGCGSGGDQGPADPLSAPAATGTGPYPTPSDAREAAPLPVGAKGTPKGGVTRPADVDQRDADAVGRGALKVMWTFDADIDSGPQDAMVRAADAGWLTKAYVARLRAYRPRSVPGAQWREWAGHGAYTVVTVRNAEDAAKPGDTTTEAWRQWTVTAAPFGRDGWTGNATTVVAYVHLTRTAADDAWRIADVNVP
ncbi:hypothetical protein ACFWP7_09355 [Streptomyces sp. NPDC058470]|uniref:hypothetical protein n=1 Tax=Streptomyces sp. NPDC058470 TaxID=3346515 RepID=UPI00365887AA